jgi:hypothetical protein
MSTRVHDAAKRGKEHKKHKKGHKKHKKLPNRFFVPLVFCFVPLCSFLLSLGKALRITSTA